MVDLGDCGEARPLYLFGPVASGTWEQEGKRHSELCGQREDSDFNVGRINLKTDTLRLYFPFGI